MSQYKDVLRHFPDICQILTFAQTLRSDFNNTISAYIIDLSAQFPTYNGTHIFTDFLSNWGQTVILFHLVFSLSMDLSGEDFRKKWKKVYNKTVQIAMAQSIIVCVLFWGLVGGEWNLQNVHEHIMNFVVMIISYTVSEVRFRRRDLCLGKFFGLSDL